MKIMYSYQSGEGAAHQTPCPSFWINLKLLTVLLAPHCRKIYTPTKLDNSKIYKATELQSGILINNGEGNFKFNPLPKIAQIAPSFGIDLSDFDGDGNLDIYMVQNFYGPEPETGHMAGRPEPTP